MYLFRGPTTDQVWKQAAKRFGDSRPIPTRPSRTGRVKETLQSVFSIQEPQQRWVVSRYPPINPAFALAEVIWIVCGRNNSRFLNYWNPDLPRFAGAGEKYHGAYGHRLRHQFGVDQIERALHVLKRNPDTRQVVLQIWDPRADFPLPDGKPVSEDVPCNVCAILKVRDKKLFWTQIMRSNDFFRGLPYNFVQFTCLQEIMAGWLGVEVGTYTHLSDSLHVYKKDEANIRNFSSITPQRNTDSLCLPKPQSDLVLAELYRRADILTKPRLDKRELLRAAVEFNLPPAFSNILLVVCADSARRRGWVTITNDLMGRCSNPALKQLWERWFARKGRQRALTPDENRRRRAQADSNRRVPA